MTLTDLKRILPQLNEGIDVNAGVPARGKFLRALPLRWGAKEDLAAVCDPPPDLIVASDCVYYEASVAPLVFTLRELARRSEEKKKCPVFVCYEERDYSEVKKKVREGFVSLAERCFAVKRCSADECHPDFFSEDIVLLRLDSK